jgi:ketosteroid isomerase-like protein
MPDVTDASLADLRERFQRAADAYIRGGIDTYLELLPHADDYTLMPPQGGETVHGFDDSEQARARTREFFAGAGQATVEVEATYASGDLAVLVVVERQHGEVGGMPDQDCSLRVTLVCRLTDDGWRIAHRHADALVHPISIERLAELARGQG